MKDQKTDEVKNQELADLLCKEMQKDDEEDSGYKVLLNWHYRTVGWLILVDERIEIYKKINPEKEYIFSKLKKAAILENPILGEQLEIYNQEYRKQELKYLEKERLIQEEKEVKLKYKNESFIYSEEEKKLQKKLQELESFDYDELEDESTCEDFGKIVSKLSFDNEHLLLQHRINDLVTIAQTYHAEDFKNISGGLYAHTQTENYKNWHQIHTAQNILNNTQFNYSDITELVHPIGEINLLFRKDYYQSCVKNNNKDLESFDEHWESYGEHAKYGKLEDIATDSDIAEFELKHDITFPEDLKTFYKTMGSFRMSMRSLGRGLTIPPLSAIDNHPHKFYVEGTSVIKWRKSLKQPFFGLFQGCIYSILAEECRAEVVDEIESNYAKSNADKLNSKFKVIGSISDEFNNIFLMVFYDEYGKFVLLSEPHGSDCLKEKLQDYLDGKYASYSLAQIIGIFVTFREDNSNTMLHHIL